MPKDYSFDFEEFKMSDKLLQAQAAQEGTLARRPQTLVPDPSWTPGRLLVAGLDRPAVVEVLEGLGPAAPGALWHERQFHAGLWPARIAAPWGGAGSSGGRRSSSDST